MQLQASDLEPHRPFLVAHCYRMLGSVVDADDAVQETMVRAWRALDRFDGRSKLETWLYRIATNVCLDALAARKRRARPMEEGPVGTVHDPLEEKPRVHWLEPIPDTAVLPPEGDPSELAAMKQSVRLAFVAALQHLPPKQRAALLLAEVLGWSAAEIAEGLDTSVAAVNSALQRARASLAGRELEQGASSLSPDQSALVDRYVSAFERYDMDALAALLHEDAIQSMPPYTLWLRGPEAITAWMTGRGAACRGSRLVPAPACGLPAFAQYKPDEGGGYSAWSINVLEIEGDRIVGLTFFLDVEALFPRFGLPLVLPA